VLTPLVLLLTVFAASGLSGCGSSTTISGAIPPTNPTSTPGSTNPGNSGGNGTGTGSSTPAPTASRFAPRFVYALDSSAVAPTGIDEFQINPETGELTNVGFASIPSNNALAGMAAMPMTSYVYVANWTTGTIVTLHADPSTGMLTTIDTMSVPQIQNVPQLLIDQAGKFLFLSNPTPNMSSIFVFAIGATGTLTEVPGSPFAVSSPVTSLSIDSEDKFLFGASGNEVFGFAIATDGSLTPTPGSPVTVRPPFENPDKGPTGVAAVVDPQARFLFVPDTVNPAMYVYTVGLDGVLSLVAGSPFPTGVAGFAPAVDPLGRFVFLGSFGAAQVAALAVNQSTGAVSPAPGSPYDNGPYRSGGTPVFQAQVDPSANFVLFADSEETKITVFAINQTTGALTNVSGSPFLAAQEPLGGGSPTTLAITH